jgi:hypothetical protein
MLDKSSYLEIVGMIEALMLKMDELRERLGGEATSGGAESLFQGLRHLKLELELEREQRFSVACATINLRDEKYTAIRVIDGDTVILAPPEELLAWMKDFRLRLYGIDTPELHETLGPLFRSLVEQVLRAGSDKPSVVMERQGIDTNYAGFPRTSFEREVGNLFLTVPEGILYVNCVLAMLPHVKTTRSGNDLIRGRKRLLRGQQGNSRLEPMTTLPNWLSKIIRDISPELLPSSPQVPLCLCVLSKNVIEASGDSPMAVWDAIVSSVRARDELFGALLVGLAASTSNFEKLLNNHQMSPFDGLLVLASEWRRAAEAESSKAMVAIGQESAMKQAN